MKFYLGLPEPAMAKRISGAAFISVNRLRRRVGPFPVGDWIMDSGAFTEIATHGRYRHPVSEYATEIRRWTGNGGLEAVVAQDFMCEPVMLERTGLSVAEHQRLTIERYDALLGEALPVPVLPVLQGFAPGDYQIHVRQYGSRLELGAWVGVGSVCKRNRSPLEVYAVLAGILRERPDLRLHGFGLKLTALAEPGITELLHSADSMAWAYAARKQGRNPNDVREAIAFAEKVGRKATAQPSLFAA